MKLLRCSALAAALALAACTASPTGGAPSADPAGPSYDGGASMGSGNRTGGPGTEGAASDTTGRGGASMGSGN